MFGETPRDYDRCATSFLGDRCLGPSRAFEAMTTIERIERPWHPRDRISRIGTAGSSMAGLEVVARTHGSKTTHQGEAAVQ